MAVAAPGPPAAGHRLTSRAWQVTSRDKSLVREPRTVGSRAKGRYHSSPGFWLAIQNSGLAMPGALSRETRMLVSHGKERWLADKSPGSRAETSGSRGGTGWLAR